MATLISGIFSKVDIIILIRYTREGWILHSGLLLQFQYSIGYKQKIPLRHEVVGGFFRINVFELLVIESQINVHGASYGATYHGVVTDAQEAHHLNVSGY